MYFTHSYALHAGRCGRRARLDRPRRPVRRRRRPGQCGGGAVPPREVARPRACGCSATFWSGGRDPLSRDRPEGRPVRARACMATWTTATVFNASPANQAEQFAKAGFDWLHVVDLNGVGEGRAVNAAAVEAILEAVSMPVQLGGGIRTHGRIEALDRGGGQPGDSGHGRGARSGPGQDAPPRNGPSRSPSASTCATARWPCRAGWRTPSLDALDRGPAVRGRRRLRPDRHRHRPRRRADRDQCRGVRRDGRRRVRSR